jgi:hypothetical protein
VSLPVSRGRCTAADENLPRAADDGRAYAGWVDVVAPLLATRPRLKSHSPSDTRLLAACGGQLLKTRAWIL